MRSSPFCAHFEAQPRAQVHLSIHEDPSSMTIMWMTHAHGCGAASAWRADAHRDSPPRTHGLISGEEGARCSALHGKRLSHVLLRRACSAQSGSDVSRRSLSSGMCVALPVSTLIARVATADAFLHRLSHVYATTPAMCRRCASRVLYLPDRKMARGQRDFEDALDHFLPSSDGDVATLDVRPSLPCGSAGSHGCAVPPVML